MEVNGAPKQPGYKLSSEYLPLCSAEQRHSYRFGTTWGWVNDDRIFIFGWSIPLKSMENPIKNMKTLHVCVCYQEISSRCQQYTKAFPSFSINIQKSKKMSSDVDVTCVLSFRSAFPTQHRWVMMKTNFQPKIGLKQPNVLTQRSQPSIWVEKITQRFLECMNRESVAIVEN